jgi:hypothetical protein
LLLPSSFYYLALVGLYEEQEKPENPLDYLKQILGSSQSHQGPSLEEYAAQVDELKKENETLKRKVSELEEKIVQVFKDLSCQNCDCVVDTTRR